MQRFLNDRNHRGISRDLLIYVLIVCSALIVFSCDESQQTNSNAPGNPIIGNGGNADLFNNVGGGGTIAVAGGGSGGAGFDTSSGNAAGRQTSVAGGSESNGAAGNTGGRQPSGGAGPTGGTSGLPSCTNDNDCVGGYCNNGTCACWSSDQTLCDGQCIGTLWNDENCGSCNNVCPASAPSCSNGTCFCHSPPCVTDSGGTTGQETAGAGGTDVVDPNLVPIQSGCKGYATRFWDCCKPHCGWPKNVPNGVTPMTSCNQTNASNGGDHDARSSCDGGNAYTCYGLAPWAIDANLSYGYAATSNGDICGRCYQIQFTGVSHNSGNDPGSSAIRGKTMVVQAINVGWDVAGGQFDVLIPGGGVGTFNACSNQWGAFATELGEQYGGFLSTCKRSLGGNTSHQAIKDCVAQKCSSVFGSRGLTELEAGCQWFVDWFQVADNPALVYKEISCPSAITNKSGMDRNPLNDVSRLCGD